MPATALRGTGPLRSLRKACALSCASPLTAEIWAQRKPKTIPPREIKSPPVLIRTRARKKSPLSKKRSRATLGPSHDVRLLGAGRFAGLEQVSLNKLIDVAIENGIGISHLDPGAVIFDHTVGMEHIGANLAAPGDFFLGFVVGLHLFFLFFDLEFIQTRPENLHGHRPILVL